MTPNELIERYSQLKFPEGFNDAGGKTFQWVFANLKDFVFFTRHWQKTTGLFKKWYEYVCAQDKINPDDSRPDITRSGGVPILDVPLAKQ